MRQVPADMREPTLPIRERPSFATTVATMRAFYWRHRETVAISVASALFMAAVGAFETSEFPPLITYPYFVVLMLAGGHIAMLALEGLAAKDVLDDAPVAQAAVVIAALCLFQTPLVWVMAAWLLEGSWAVERNFVLLPSVLLVGASFATLQQLALRARRAELAPVPAALSPDNARAALIGHEPALWAVEADDHYLRLHTASGSRLVLMRFADAVAQLAAADGAQTHRSWWVARRAVVSATRGNGRAVLTLKNGLTVPVSRTHAAALRRAGWFRRQALPSLASAVKGPHVP